MAIQARATQPALSQGSIGLQLLRAAIDGSSRQAIRNVRLDLFTEDERPAIEFALNHIDQHGMMPSVQIMAENGFVLAPSTGNISYYLERLRSRAIHNAGSSGAQGLLTALKARNDEDVVQIVRQMNDQIGDVTTSQSTISLGASLQSVWHEYQVARNHPGMRGITTGFEVVDTITGGLRPGDVTTLVARPGVGKSWTIMKMAIAAWLSGSSIAFVSMEMTAIETARRLMGMVTGVNPDFIARGQMSHWAEENVQAWMGTIDGLPPFNMLIGDLSKSTRDVDHMIQEFEPDIGYIDASYLLKPTKDGLFRGKRWENAAETAEDIKSVALRRERHIVQTVQFNRTSTLDEEMDLGQIGGTDVYGQISSLAIGIRIGAAPNERTQRRYQVLKNRHGIDWLRFETFFGFNPFNMDVIGSNLPTGEEGESVDVDLDTPGDMENI